MSQDRITRTWRRHFVKKLQQTYGLAKEEALLKADLWLRWLKEVPGPQPWTKAEGSVQDHYAPSLISAHRSRARVSPLSDQPSDRGQGRRTRPSA